jgi:uncharacterized membrane protein
MSAANEIYLNEELRLRSRRRAFKVWSIGLIAVTAWLLLILAAPVAQTSGNTYLGNALYTFFSYLCHQIPQRTFHLSGEPLAVCTRCFGVYLGIVLGFAVYPLWRDTDHSEPPPRLWLFLSLVPIGIDWSLTVLDVWENTSISRALTGLILGVVCATFILPALVEVFRNLGRNSRYGPAQ